MGRRTNSTNQKSEPKKEKQPKMTPEQIAEKYGSKSKPLNYKVKFNPLSETQDEYYNMILTKRITFGTGVAGTGKSFVCLNAALRLLSEDNTYKRILILVPTVESGNMNLGFLPGSRQEKIQPYLEADFQTLTDILDLSGNDGEKIMGYLIENKLIVGDAISFMRGKTIKNSIVIISEAENFNKQEMMLLLSRIAPTSKYIINGDNRQQDRKDIKDNKNGLKHAMDTLKDKIGQIGFSHFLRKDIVRDPLIEEIMDAWFVGDSIDENY